MKEIELQKELVQEITLLKEFITKNLHNKESPAETKFMSIDKLIVYLMETKDLKISKSSIYKMTSLGDIPYKKAGNKLVFIREEIDQWFETKINSDNKINNNVQLSKVALKKKKYHGNIK